MARRWTCPECGKGINAPERMNRLDPRRYCLSCSGKVGVTRLVERSCAYLEKRRETSSAKRKAKVKRAKVKRNRKPWCLRDDLIQKEFSKAKRVYAKLGYDVSRAHLDKIEHRRSGMHTTGRAWCWSGRITIRVGNLTKLPAIAQKARVLMVLYHELAHIAAPGSEHHGDKFRAIYSEAACQAFGIELTKTYSTVYGGLDAAIRNGIEDSLKPKESEK